ncbi:MAG: cytochrome-c oxidase, cbb3-type subunit III [Gammaproteobacteria bacterium]|jgi:cytochrome c oxidase cbb3-type subunit 3|nr:cytochrome-c oxidase, cbb3-type subunit III [Gammaproteobacteria bacterium]
MLNSFWNWFVIIITVGSILACWWLLHWTKGVSDRSPDDDGSTGHIWDEDIRELNTPLPRWWLHLFNITIVFALVYLVIFPGLGNFAGISGWSQIGQYDAEVARATEAQESVFGRFREMDPDALMADSEAMEIGGRLFGNNCAMCHGSDGRGAKSFPNLTDGNWLWGGSYDQVLTSITKGRIGAMPPMGAALGEDGTREVVAYVQQLSGQKADPDMAAAGQARFQTVCMACHGMDGTGNQALGAPNLTDDIWLYGGSPADIEATINNGRNGNMPAHENLLHEDRLRLLAAYVMGLSES